MAISSQNLKEILESFKAQLFHTLDDRLDAFVHGLTDSLTASQTASMIVFVVFKIH
jgi:cytochrome c peroxidase